MEPAAEEIEQAATGRQNVHAVANLRSAQAKHPVSKPGLECLLELIGLDKDTDVTSSELVLSSTHIWNSC